MPDRIQKGAWSRRRGSGGQPARHKTQHLLGALKQRLMRSTSGLMRSDGHNTVKKGKAQIRSAQTGTSNSATSATHWL